jgi:hypothetical protein
MGGRPPGGQNVTTRQVREMVIECARKLGGLQRFYEWAKESERNEMLFWTQCYMRIMPIAIRGTGPHGVRRAAAA